MRVRRIVVSALALLAASMLASSAAWAASVPVDLNADVTAGFLPDPNVHPTIGYVYSLQAGGTTLSPDLALGNPNHPGSTLPNLVAVIASANWNGAPTGTLTIDAYVSQANAFKLLSYVQRPALLPTLRFTFAVLSYNPATHLYYPAFTGPAGTPISTSPAVNGGGQEVSVSTIPVPVADGIDVNIYEISFTAAAPLTSQPLTYQSSASARAVAKPWGVIPLQLGLGLP